jgi:deoxyribonuclease V
VLNERSDWPQQDAALVALQVRFGAAAEMALADDPWVPSRERILFGACFVAFARGSTGPGHAGDRAWAAAVTWAGDPVRQTLRWSDDHLRGSDPVLRPRRADDVLAQSVVTGRVEAAYIPGLVARREGPILAAALTGLDPRPEVVLVDASGLDHPRHAGLALHLGAALGIPSVGVTRRPLVAAGDRPPLRRGEVAPLRLAGRCVAFWVCTRTGTQPLVAHGAWRTSPHTAVRVVMAASTAAARTPVPLQEARRVAREARSIAGAS